METPGTTLKGESPGWIRFIKPAGVPSSGVKPKQIIFYLFVELCYNKIFKTHI